MAAAAPESNDQHVGAFLDQALGARARGIDVGLEVGVHQLDVHAEHVLDHAGGEVGALLARLADEAQIARARQDHAHLQFLRLGPDDSWKCRSRCKRGKGLVELAAFHGIPPR